MLPLVYFCDAALLQAKPIYLPVCCCLQLRKGSEIEVVGLGDTPWFVCLICKRLGEGSDHVILPVERQSYQLVHKEACKGQPASGHSTPRGIPEQAYNHGA